MANSTKSETIRYGTLQVEEVQLDTFGRKLEGHADALPGFTLRMIEIQDQDFVAKAVRQFIAISNLLEIRLISSKARYTP